MHLQVLFNTMKSKKLKFSVFFPLLLFLFNPALSSGSDSLFVSDDVIKMELRSDFTAIQQDRSEDPKYHDAELIYQTPEGEKVKLSVKIMVRGNFRRDPKHCEFPPLFVNFKKSEVKNTYFENQDRLKLVTHCQFEEDLIEEYTVYRLYNEITDISFKVRLARITYFDTVLNKKLFQKFSFFIEDKDHVAERNNAFEKDRFLSPFDVDHESYKKLAVFQYMIGNKDWYVSSRKNIVIMQHSDTLKLPYAVPYDFDFSGFVNAAYTKPRGVPEDLLAERRIYKGICYTFDEFSDIVKYFEDKRPVFESIIKKQKLISLYTRKEILVYIDQFYTILGDSEMIKKEFLVNCETKKNYNIVD